MSGPMSLASDAVTSEDTSCVNCRKNLILLNKCNFVIELLEATIQKKEEELRDAVAEARAAADVSARETLGQELCTKIQEECQDPWHSAKEALRSCTGIIQRFQEEFVLIRKCMDNLAIKVETLEEAVHDLNKHSKEHGQMPSGRLVQEFTMEMDSPSNLRGEVLEAESATSQALGRQVEGKRDSMASLWISLQQRDQDVVMLNRMLRRLDEVACSPVDYGYQRIQI
ncbi:hypothetical protein GUITHDRAFT_137130 [Guillardia theta CCMP2712]|uniref:Uncharacterized protein n=1 Tax=Guillardia theta (strain CCMP2712) TaxID=905079 RepID=L1JGT3_GUITC|nr:hypothetical protein GUITHDRAFT_137130 [Guillardia theta CCMP2712]EKX47733.1 hypothetical protein GUITHDRAFT_137130 [Guillardia theta CCMP2712]|eukprot:XP_005834713.1 hypothetical protein GUITHDRAFT_137130 [Guillardia theta CCMP2712]